MPNLAGLHDIESVKIAPPDTWVVDTVALSESPAPKTYPASLNVIARMNWGYGSTGTIPVVAQYPSFGQKVAQYVKGSTGCRRWIIGNEPNLPREWPNGQPIFPWNYAACLHICREEIHALPGHASDEVLLAAPGPWNADLKYDDNPKGDWIKNFADTIALLNGHFDGFALHAYTHRYDPALVTSTARMDAPFQDRYYEFYTYRDYMHAIPLALENLPVYITESNGGPGWQAVGLMPAMLAEIDKWNHSLTQPISCVVFFRYPNKNDGYEMVGRDAVIAEYQAAVSHGYTSPDEPKGATDMPNSTFIPAVSNGTQTPTSPPRDIDPRLTQRGTVIEEEAVEPGQSYWRLVKAQFFDHTQAGGRHHVYVEAVDENGNPVANVPFVYSWPGKSVPIMTNGKTGFDAANQPFSEGRNAFAVQPAQHGDIVRGIGMGEDDPGGWNAGEHTATLLRYQRQVAPSDAQQPAADPAPAQPAPTGPTATPNVPAGANVRVGASTLSDIIGAVPNGQPMAVTGKADGEAGRWYQVDSPYGPGWVFGGVVSIADGDNIPTVTPPAQPETPTPTPNGDWNRILTWLHKQEGGFQDFDWDAGNWTGCKQGVGEKKGTNFGISACAYPNLDIRNLTQPQADNLFFQDYYVRSGAYKLPWPLNLLAMNAAVNFHPLTAAEWVKESGGDAMQLFALQLAGYRHSTAWKQAGDAWMDRLINLAQEAKL